MVVDLIILLFLVTMVDWGGFIYGQKCYIWKKKCLI